MNKEVDKSGMLDLVNRLPKMFEEAVSFSQKVQLPKVGKVRQIIVCGMGGSAISGDIAGELLAEATNVFLAVNRNYFLPGYADKNTLIFTISYSGNTEETLSAYDEALKLKVPIIAITSGGKLKSQAEADGYPVIVVPRGLPPRAALGYMLTALLITLERLEILPGVGEQILETVDIMKRLKSKYTQESDDNPTLALAKKVKDKIPIVFAADRVTEVAGLRWKTQLNENSKVMMLLDVFPELNHNELVNLSTLKVGEHSFCLIFLRDKNEHPRVAKRFEITKDLLNGGFPEVTEIWAEGKSYLARLMSLIYFGDYVSVYLAILRGVDPTPVKVIEELKRRLAQSK